MPEQNPITSRQITVGLFAMMAGYGAWYKFSDTAKPGSYTSLFDISLIVVGLIGMTIALLWPRKDKPPDQR